MIEKVTVEMTEDGKFRTIDGPRCDEMNPKEMLLYAAAQCSGYTALMVMRKMHLTPRNLEIAYSGELSTETLQAESVFRSFHVVYNVACGSGSEQEKASRAIELTHEKYCGLSQMLRRIAPITREVAIVSTEPEPVKD
ncbi:MAG: OsmC family protein [Alistipes sp.]|nr:OsmC family protein [Alistipes senegalensis]MCM1251086.1 OsmC family protein [Alistipes sp.]